MSVKSPLHVRVAAALGGWNDRHLAQDTYATSSRIYRAIDRFSGWLYCLGEKGTK